MPRGKQPPRCAHAAIFNSLITSLWPPVLPGMMPLFQHLPRPVECCHCTVAGHATRANSIMLMMIFLYRSYCFYSYIIMFIYLFSAARISNIFTITGILPYWNDYEAFQHTPHTFSAETDVIQHLGLLSMASSTSESVDDAANDSFTSPSSGRSRASPIAIFGGFITSGGR